MPNLWVYFEENPTFGELEPVRLNIYFGRGGIRWDKPYFYQQLEIPFERRTPADWYDEDVCSVSINQNELVRNEDKPDHFGIYLPAVIERIEQQLAEARKEFGGRHEQFDFENIEQFIIQISDIEDVMQMQLRQFYDRRF